MSLLLLLLWLLTDSIFKTILLKYCQLHIAPLEDMCDNFTELKRN